MKAFTPITEICRELRKNMTPAERKLWKHLRSKRLCGIKFLRQHPIVFAVRDRHKYFYVADFYCAKGKLIIELDGAVHKQTKAHDIERDNKLRSRGFKILRIKNEELKEMERLKKKILNELES